MKTSQFYYCLLLSLISLISFKTESTAQALQFNGKTNYVNAGNNSSFQLSNFTIEAWIKKNGVGKTTSTGSVTATPLITKGNEEGDSTVNINLNYFLGINKNSNIICDFEESNGRNRKLTSKTVIQDSVWTHIAATYDVTTGMYKIYVNGILDTAKRIGNNIKPNSASMQPLAIASSLTSLGVAKGFFNGAMDEVRIWNVTRTEEQILQYYNRELNFGEGLVARFSLNDSSGTKAKNSITSINGSLINSPLWIAGYPSFFSGANQSGFSTTVISTGWNQPVGLTFNKAGDKMFVWEKEGKVWVMDSSSKKLLIDISPEVGDWRDLGLLGFALDPGFDKNGYFYLLYTVDRHHLLYYGTANYNPKANDYYSATISRVTRYTATNTNGNYTVDTLTRKILLGATKETGIPSLYESHGPGSLVFGTDGTLLISCGEGSSYIGLDSGSNSKTYYKQALADGIITPEQNVGAFRSQLLTSYNGKVLRIDPATGKGVTSNPFYDSNNPNSAKSKVWALGFRNPFRMTLKPGTGSNDPAAGNPGVLYVGDVGFNTWEEINAVTKGGMNFGWPLFEGLQEETDYMAKNTYNQTAPNPLYNTNGCAQPYFRFKDLIQQEAVDTPSFVNPCNPDKAIPSGVQTFMHARPLIDWKHADAGPSRTGIFISGEAATAKIGGASSPVSGPQFGGGCSIAGVFYAKDDFPSDYKNSLFFADYGRTWVRSMKVSSQDKPVSISNAIDTNVIVVAMTTNPAKSGIYYVDYQGMIKRITYNQPVAPTAVIDADKLYGATPVKIQFSGTNSFDENGSLLKYKWNFGDGSTSTLADPSHSFSSLSNKSYTDTVTLTVTNSLGLSNTAILVISLNNTPPVVNITSPINNARYSITDLSTYNLTATVNDKEDANRVLKYEWQTILHHADHEHPNPVDTNKVTTATLTPIGCDEVYYYRVVLKVTDPSGLSTTKEVRLYPNCNQKITSYTLVNADNGQDIRTLSAATVDTINLATLPTSHLNIRINTSPSTVKSVIAYLSGARSLTRTDGGKPFSVFGDKSGAYSAWAPDIGSYFLESYPYSGSSGSGNAGSGMNAQFVVVKKASSSFSALNDLYSKINFSNKDSIAKIFPNPFRNSFTLVFDDNRFKNANCIIYDNKGEKVLTLSSVKSNQMIFLGKSFAAGEYYVVIESEVKERRVYKAVKLP